MLPSALTSSARCLSLRRHAASVVGTARRPRKLAAPQSLLSAYKFPNSKCHLPRLPPPLGTIMSRKAYCTETKEVKAEDLPIANTTYMKAYEEYCAGKSEAALKLLDSVEPNDQYYALALALRGRISTLNKDFKKALEWFDESLKVNDATSLTYYYKASVHEILKEYDEAIRCLCDCVDIDPNFALARTDLAGLYIATGDPQLAIEHCNFCLQSNPEMEQALYWKARAFYEMKQYKEAMEILKNYNDYGDTFAVRLAALSGDVRLALGEPAKAKELYLSGYKENMDQFPDTSLVKLCKLHLDSGAPSEALKLMRMRIVEEEALKVDSDSGDQLFKCFANVRYHNGDTRGAIQSYQRSLDLNKMQLDAWQELIRLQLETDQLQECYDSVIKALETFPLDTGLRKLKIAVGLDLGLIEEVMQELTALDKGDPALTASLLPWRCFAYFLQGKTDECDNLYQAIKEFPFEPLGTLYMAKLGWAKGDAEGAERHLRHLLKPKTSLFYLSNAASMASLTMRDMNLASKILAFIVKHHPNHVLYITQLARVRQLLGHLDFALTVWDHVSKVLPQDAKAWVAMGDIYVQQDKTMEALTQFKRAQTCTGPDEDVAEAAAKEGLTLLMLRRWKQGLDKLEETTTGLQFTDTALRIYGMVLSGQGKDMAGIDLPSEYLDLEHAANLFKQALSHQVSVKLGEASTLVALSKTLRALNRNGEAATYAERAKALGPES